MLPLDAASLEQPVRSPSYLDPPSPPPHGRHRCRAEQVLPGASWALCCWR